MADGSINVLSAEVWWGDTYENAPSVTFHVDRDPEWKVYDKRPGGSAGLLSAEQEAVIGRRAPVRPTPGYNVYWTQDGDFVWFFSWGGKPDDGFGGWRREIELADGTVELVVGGWHVSPSIAVSAGFPKIIETAYISPGHRVGVACFVTVERFEREVAIHLPDVEVTGSTVKWRGQPSKAQFMAAERERRDIFRDEMKAKYSDGSWHHGNWYKKMTADEKVEMACRPYSALGPTGVIEEPGIRTKNVAR